MLTLTLTLPLPLTLPLTLTYSQEGGMLKSVKMETGDKKKKVSEP